MLSLKARDYGKKIKPEIVKLDKNKTKLYGGYKRHTLNIKTKIG